MGHREALRGTGEFRLRDAAITIYAPSALFSISQGGAVPLVALVAIDRGAGVPLAAVISSLVGIGSIIGNVPASMVAARFGERRAMLVATVVSVAGLCVCAVDLGLVVLAIGVFAQGLATSSFQLARQLYLTNAAPPHMRARAMSTLGGVARLGMFIGPFFASAAIALGDLSAGFVTAIVTAFAAGAIVLFVPDPADHSVLNRGPVDARIRDVARAHARDFLTLGLGVTFMAMVRQGRQVAIPLWGDHIGLDPAMISVIVGLSSGVDMLLFYPAGYVMDRRGRRVVAVFCTLILGLSYLFIPLTTATWSLLLVALLVGVGNGIGSGIGTTLGADLAPAEGRAIFLGLWREFADIGTGAGPLLISALTALAGLSVGVLGVGATGLVSAAIFARWVPGGPPNHEVERLSDE